MGTSNQKVWDRHAIKAEIHRRGQTLTRLALAAGLDPSACRSALMRPSPGGEAAISAFLGIPPQILWPDRYDASGNRRPSSQLTNPAQEIAQKRGGG